ncbi:hypothetical protein [Paenibacillus gansuensis]|uniref:Uncharacterized protein n=1 Tax=Paenibacillus gansuensis TaxID=306542 RepID=A0ABW5PLZ0_9BACL
MSAIEEAVTYINIAITKIDEDRIIAGVELVKREGTEAGKASWIPYVVMSLYYAREGDRRLSVRQTLLSVCYEAMRYVDDVTETVIYRCGSDCFVRSIEYREHVRAFANQRGVKTVIVRHHTKFIPNIMQLANDALERGESIIAAL